MGFFEDLFDLNGDGKVDLLDDLDAMMIMDMLDEEDADDDDASILDDLF